MVENAESWMRLALEEARLASAADEVPVGAVVVGADGRMLSRAQNQTIGASDPTGHAELVALRRAAKRLGNYRLPGTTLVVTIEPCVMCMGAAIHSRVAHIIFGAPDPKWGAAGSLYDFAGDSRFNHRPVVTGGVLADDCRRIMQSFFKNKRNQQTG